MKWRVLAGLVALATILAGCGGGGCHGPYFNCGPGISFDPEEIAAMEAERERTMALAERMCVQIPAELEARVLGGLAWGTTGDWGYWFEEAYLAAVRIDSDHTIVRARVPLGTGGGQREINLLVTGAPDNPDIIEYVPTPTTGNRGWANPTIFDAVDQAPSFYTYPSDAWEAMQRCKESGPFQRPLGGQP